VTGKQYVVATDVGGTCTDTVVFTAGESIRLGKVLSTPPDFSLGVMESINSASASMDMSMSELLAHTTLFIHGTTVIDNTVLARGGAKTGLVTTRGFEDTLLVTRGAYGRYAGLTEEGIKHPVMTDRPEPLVSAELIQGVPERVDYKGSVLLELDEKATERALRYLLEQGVGAVAVCLLWSFYNDRHEKRIAEILKQINPDIYTSLSCEVAPVLGEYERTSTTVINAYAGRVAHDYLTRLQQELDEAGYRGPVLVMQGYGGLLPAAEAADFCVGLIEGGPAAGVIGSKYLGELMGDFDIIAADMGGTTFKVGVIQKGELEYSREPLVARHHYVAPKIEVISIGAGGGSIVTLDPRTHRPRIGPRSAGADPGPVCYGRGGRETTMTDVLLLIGYLDPNIFLDGTLKLDVAPAIEALRRDIAEPMGVDVREAAIGIYRVAVAQTADVIRTITVERGVDPREFVLHAYGGTCPLICAAFGEELGVRRIVVPYTAAVNCALGLVSADVVHEYNHTATLPMAADPVDINAIFEPMEVRARSQLRDEGFPDDRVSVERAIDLHYFRQIHEVTTPVRGRGPMDREGLDALEEDFEALYEKKFGKGSTYRGAGMEMTAFRLSVRGLMTRPKMEKQPLQKTIPKDAKLGQRDILVLSRQDIAPARVYHFDRLMPGNVIAGPAVIHTPFTTIVVQDDQNGRLDEYRNFVIDFE